MGDSWFRLSVASARTCTRALPHLLSQYHVPPPCGMGPSARSLWALSKACSTHTQTHAPKAQGACSSYCSCWASRGPHHYEPARHNVLREHVCPLHEPVHDLQSFLHLEVKCQRARGMRARVVDGQGIERQQHRKGCPGSSCVPGRQRRSSGVYGAGICMSSPLLGSLVMEDVVKSGRSRTERWPGLVGHITQEKKNMTHSLGVPRQWAIFGRCPEALEERILGVDGRGWRARCSRGREDSGQGHVGDCAASGSARHAASAPGVHQQVCDRPSRVCHALRKM